MRGITVTAGSRNPFDINNREINRQGEVKSYFNVQQKYMASQAATVKAKEDECQRVIIERGGMNMLNTLESVIDDDINFTKVIRTPKFKHRKVHSNQQHIECKEKVIQPVLTERRLEQNQSGGKTAINYFKLPVFNRKQEKLSIVNVEGDTDSELHIGKKLERKEVKVVKPQKTTQSRFFNPYSQLHSNSFRDICDKSSSIDSSKHQQLQLFIEASLTPYFQKNEENTQQRQIQSAMG